MEWINEGNQNVQDPATSRCVAALIAGGVIVACGGSGYLCGSFCAIQKR